MRTLPVLVRISIGAACCFIVCRAVDTFICPDGTKSVQCLTNPCEVTQCERYPYARCEVDYCGRCKATFIDNDGSVLDCCEQNDDPCASIRCGFYAQCKRGRCVCPFVCYKGYIPVCGSDGNTYRNECSMRVTACKTQQDIHVQHMNKCQHATYTKDAIPQDTFICPDGTKSVQCPTNPCEVTQCERYPYARCEVDYCGGCIAKFIDNDGSVLDCAGQNSDPCASMRCGFYAQCKWGRCVCPSMCYKGYIPVCGSDGNTYRNECSMRVTACKNRQNIYVQHMHKCQHDKNRCTGSSHSGHCRAMLLRWYFDQSTGTCEPFIYSGCGGNRNRFWSKWKCKQKCLD